MADKSFGIRAGDEIRTRDPNLGKVVLYQLSYSRLFFISILTYVSAATRLLRGTNVESIF